MSYCDAGSMEFLSARCADVVAANDRGDIDSYLAALRSVEEFVEALTLRAHGLKAPAFDSSDADTVTAAAQSFADAVKAGKLDAAWGAYSRLEDSVHGILERVR